MHSAQQQASKAAQLTPIELLNLQNDREKKHTLIFIYICIWNRKNKQQQQPMERTVAIRSPHITCRASEIPYVDQWKQCLIYVLKVSLFLFSNLLTILWGMKRNTDNFQVKFPKKMCNRLCNAPLPHSCISCHIHCNFRWFIGNLFSLIGFFKIAKNISNRLMIFGLSISRSSSMKTMDPVIIDYCLNGVTPINRKIPTNFWIFFIKWQKQHISMVWI